MSTEENRRSKLRTCLRWGVRGSGLLLLFLLLLLVFWFRNAIYHRAVQFPREAAAWQRLRTERKPVKEDGGWTEYRGILHSHSSLSHDSEVPFPEILRVLKVTGLDFICLSDHCTDGRADFNRQWRGLHGGKLFIPGYEMKDGIMPFGVKSDLVLSNQTDPQVLAEQIVQGGGLLFYAHPEEPRVWSRPELAGMEIYNIHSDFKKSGEGLVGFLPDLILNQRRYPDQVFRLLFHRPTDALKKWDELNETRHITGIAGNDCHQNTGFRAWVTSTNTIRLEDTSPRTLKEVRLNWLTRPLARMVFGSLTPGRKLFHFQLDPYERMARFVNTHALAQSLSEPALMESLKAGRVFVGFDMIADSAGFRWLAKNDRGSAVMGETLDFLADTHLRAVSPQYCRFTVLRHGTLLSQLEGFELDWQPPGPGKYRVEASLKVNGKWVPWVYANPIELR